MRSGLVLAGVAAAIFFSVGLALADDGGHPISDGTQPLEGESVDGASFEAGPSNPCDGGLCETETGTTCSVVGMAPGRFSPSPDGVLGIVGLLALARLVRGSKDESSTGAPCPHSGWRAG